MNPITLLLVSVLQLANVTLSMGPTTIPTGYSHAVITLNVSPLNYEDTSLQIGCGFDVSYDNGSTWVPMGAFVWTGGHFVSKSGVVNPAPSLYLEVPEMAGNTVRTLCTPNKAVIFGATTTLT